MANNGTCFKTLRRKWSNHSKTDTRESAQTVKAKFGLAWIARMPNEDDKEVPLGWQVEIEDTPNKVTEICKGLIDWVNHPPLKDCNPKYFKTNEIADIESSQNHNFQKNSQSICTCSSTVCCPTCSSTNWANEQNKNQMYPQNALTSSESQVHEFHKQKFQMRLKQMESHSAQNQNQNQNQNHNQVVPNKMQRGCSQDRMYNNRIYNGPVQRNHPPRNSRDNQISTNTFSGNQLQRFQNRISSASRVDEHNSVQYSQIKAQRAEGEYEQYVKKYPQIQSNQSVQKVQHMGQVQHGNQGQPVNQVKQANPAKDGNQPQQFHQRGQFQQAGQFHQGGHFQQASHLQQAGHVPQGNQTQCQTPHMTHSQQVHQTQQAHQTRQADPTQYPNPPEHMNEVQHMQYGQQHLQQTQQNARHQSISQEFPQRLPPSQNPQEVDQYEQQNNQKNQRDYQYYVQKQFPQREQVQNNKQYNVAKADVPEEGIYNENYTNHYAYSEHQPQYYGDSSYPTQNVAAKDCKRNMYT